ncbi:rod shape-determining protein MreC [Egibacter rhizosphaerae]|uniref:rod shape-determining protein MreC n=1 Tax=Egibacter rhizosphaerae TaxID=1670831 RepID=UPI0013F16107|nr:rod shape-determining protein MreC [Egibacter rhizosphaerae]
MLTLVALLLITFDYRQGDSGPIAEAQRGALVAFAPLQEGFSQALRPVGAVLSAVGDLGSMRAENVRLQQEVEQLEEQLPSVADLERENRELREQLEMRERYELETVAAEVIGEPPGEQGHSIIVDRGADQGIASGMATVSTRGLIGKVTEVTPEYARIELLTSPNARYAVRVAESGETALLRGQGAQPFQLELLDPEADAPQGSEVVTRTFQTSTIPDGLPVGEVSSPDEADVTSPRFHQVRPFVDFRRLSTVQIVLDAETAPGRFDPSDIVDSPESSAPDPPDLEEEDDEDDDEEGEDGDDEDNDDEDNDDG